MVMVWEPGPFLLVTGFLVTFLSMMARPDDLDGVCAVHDIPVLPEAPQLAGAGGAPDASF